MQRRGFKAQATGGKASSGMSITGPVKNGLANLGITQGSRLAVGDSSNAGRSQVEPVDLPISHASDDEHAYQCPIQYGANCPQLAGVQLTMGSCCRQLSTRYTPGLVPIVDPSYKTTATGLPSAVSGQNPGRY